MLTLILDTVNQQTLFLKGKTINSLGSGGHAD